MELRLSSIDPRRAPFGSPLLPTPRCNMSTQALFRSIFSSLVASVLLTQTVFGWQLVYQRSDGPGKGKQIVFLAGDHEYRSEESLPELARILSKHHGFRCTVLFNIDKETGEIVAGNSNMPGMEALETADLAVVFLRFQNFPPDQMKHFDAYLQRGGPIVGLRTATHAFKMKASDPFRSTRTTRRKGDMNSGLAIKSWDKRGWVTTGRIMLRAPGSRSSSKRRTIPFCAACATFGFKRVAT